MNALRIQGLALTLACVLSMSVSSLATAKSYGFSISVDGEHVAGDAPVRAEPRATDVRLESMDIQVRYDGLELRPVLNVLTNDLRSAYPAGERVTFRLTTNYGAFIDRAELIITDSTGKIAALLPIGADGLVSWTMPGEGASDYFYVARAHGAQGRFDETAPLRLRRTDRAAPGDAETMAARWGEDRASKRTITLNGGAVTVSGTGLNAGAEVMVLGETIPVDINGKFVVQRILPSGEQSVAIDVLPRNGNRVAFRRDVVIPEDDWFYVAIADVTVGARSQSALLEPAATGEFTEFYLKGRTAFYLKGKIKGEYLLTASGDTGEGTLGEMFTGILTKDPQGVLSRIKPDDYYPVYGDDSELVNDAPTKGKFYVRLERGDSRVMWGTYRTQIDSGGLYADNRVLYGAQAVLRTDQVTSHGEARASLDAHAALPGTLGQRDELLGTGGSAYILHQQDIVADSEVLTVEIRDALTGIVKSTRRLVKGTDYRINYLQGTVILSAPLTPTAGSQPFLGGEADAQYLVVQYEYVPLAAPNGDYALAANGRVWLNDHLSLGATAVKEQREGRSVSLLGGSARLQASEGTYVELEAMQSDSRGVGSWTSTDGGLTFVEQAIAASSSEAMAYRVAARADLRDFGLEGDAGATLEYREAGFAATGAPVAMDQLLLSTFAELQVTDAVGVRGDYDRVETPDSLKDNASIAVDYTVAPDLVVSLGLHHARAETPTGDTARTNLGVRVEHEMSEDVAYYVYGRKTVARQGAIGDDDRLGAGIEYDMSDALSLFGEVSIGTTGPGVEAGIVHQPTPDERNHIGYRLGANPGLMAAGGEGTNSGLVVGSERRINEVATMHSEAIYNVLGPNHTLTQSYGVTLTPDAMWTVQGAVGRGQVFDPDAEDFERTSVSLGVGYVADDITGHLRGEYRNQQSELGSRDADVGLLSSSLSWRTSDDWRLLANLDAIYSLSDGGAVQDGNYIEANLGYAYRPVDNERFNALARYTLLYDLPSAGQVSATGVTPGPAQRSHVFSVDANYDINEFITVGAKYGARIGEVSLTGLEQDFVSSSAHLGIVRVDVEAIEGWEVLLEGRAMLLPEANSLDAGGLLALYRDFGDNVKLGLGYNFTGFSDDLTDLSMDHHGVFFNAIAKY